MRTLILHATTVFECLAVPVTVPVRLGESIKIRLHLELYLLHVNISHIKRYKNNFKIHQSVIWVPRSRFALKAEPAIG
jgi:hypothetical protein